MATSSEDLRRQFLAQILGQGAPQSAAGGISSIANSLAAAIAGRSAVGRAQTQEREAEAVADADRIGGEVGLRDALVSAGIDPGRAGGIASAPEGARGALLGLLPKPSAAPSPLDVAKLGLDRDRLAESKRASEQSATQKRLDREQRAAENRAQRVPSVIRTLEALGIDPQSEEGVALVTQTLTKPQVQIGGKPPTGFRFKEASDPMQGVEAIPGGPADRMSPEAAAKTQLVAQGATDVRSAREMIINSDGSINRKLLGAANVPIIGGPVPGSDGVLLFSLMFNAVNAQLRAESGAAVPEQEVIRGMDRFLPSPFDNEETVNSKLDRLEGLLDGTLKASGREAAPTTEATLPAADSLSTGALEAAEPASPATQEDFDALPSGAVFIDPGDGKMYRKP
ncbi:MAG: hypothetical protein ACR2P3_07115 [Geminicoccaceae bacterium]